MYLDRIEHSVPESSRAAQKTADELADYLQALKDKKDRTQAKNIY